MRLEWAWRRLAGIRRRKSRERDDSSMPVAWMREKIAKVRTGRPCGASGRIQAAAFLLRRFFGWGALYPILAHTSVSRRIGEAMPDLRLMNFPE